MRERTLKIIKKLRKLTRGMTNPASTLVVERFGKDPYLILISCLLSLRTRDVVSFPVSCHLFEYAKTPKQMVKLPISTIEKIVHPVGFYRQKARQIHSVSQRLIDDFGGKVPHTRDELISIKGIGPKTANLVLGVAFDIPAICVDTHVHRLANHLGLVHTKTPEQTEIALMAEVPKRYWIELNHLLVMWGQNGCKSNRACHCERILAAG